MCQVVVITFLTIVTGLCPSPSVVRHHFHLSIIFLEAIIGVLPNFTGNFYVGKDNTFLMKHVALSGIFGHLSEKNKTCFTYALTWLYHLQ